MPPTAAPFTGAGFELVTHGRHYHDFTVGQVIPHHWGRTIIESDVVTFATAACLWHPLHLNVEFARAHGHPALVVPPALVLSVVVGLSVEDLSELGGPFLGLNECVFKRSVHAGETLTAESEVTAMRQSESRAGTGIVTWRTIGRSSDEQVISFERTNLVAVRPETAR